MSTSIQACRVCSNFENNQEYRVREMLLGTRKEYGYIQCGSCGCLQLANIPDDLSQFYPPEYCAYKDYRKRTRKVWRRVVDSGVVAANLPKPGIAGRVLNSILPPLDYIAWAQYTGVDRDSRILDVGCGNGKLLIRMSMGGFRNLDGVDPFIGEDINCGDAVRIRKIGIKEFLDSKPERYPLVMLHHTFEHVPDPVETLLELKQLMQDDGFLLIRIPVADSHSREHYGENWYSWDAPRHTYLHTLKSMSLLAEKTGYVIRKVEHDATFHQLRNSELYVQGVPGNKHSRDVVARFSRDQVKQFKTLTKKLNSEQRGEQAAFFLQKADAAGRLKTAA